MAEQEPYAVRYPKLADTQMTSLGQCPLTTLQRFRDGDKLFEAGDCDSRFFVVKSGAVEIVDESGETPAIIKVHGPGEFCGEVAQLTGSPALVTGVARGECEVYGVSPGALRQLLNQHPALGDIILHAFMARRHALRDSGAYTGLRVIGSRDSQDAFRVRDFLAKNRVPFTWTEMETDGEAKKLLLRFEATEADAPVVAWGRKLLLRNPSNRKLAETIGLCRPLEKRVYDLVVVGAGPAGLAAAVYGASEGLHTLVLERTAPGGQAGRSMRIENYLGFPTGLTGSELAERAVIQANKFGANIPVATQASRLTFDDSRTTLHLECGEEIAARCLLIATGADYRMVVAEGCERFEGRGIYYAATPMEAQMCRGSDVVVVGGGNSAGQAAVFLSGQVRKVYLVIRGNDLNKDMSSYLVGRIEQTPNIELLRNTTVRRMAGNAHLEELELADAKTGAARTVRTPALFSFIGATPRTDWLPKEIQTDPRGFVCTGPGLAGSPFWTREREPFLLETTRPGVFAAGDVRSGSVKRVASAVGEGSMAVQFVHACLKEL